MSIDRFQNLNLREDANKIIGSVYAIPDGEDARTKQPLLGMIFDIIEKQKLSGKTAVSNNILSSGEISSYAAVNQQREIQFTGYLSEFVVQYNQFTQLLAFANSKISIVQKYTGVADKVIGQAHKFISKATSIYNQADRAIKDLQAVVDPFAKQPINSRRERALQALTLLRESKESFKLNVFNMNLSEDMLQYWGKTNIASQQKKFSWQTLYKDTLYKDLGENYTKLLDQVKITTRWHLTDFRVESDDCKEYGMLSFDLTFQEVKTYEQVEDFSDIGRIDAVRELKKRMGFTVGEIKS